MKMGRDMGAVFWSICISIAYATLRYNLCKGVPWSDWPVFIVNKAAALSALILLVVFAVQKARGREQGLAGLMATAFSLALLHVALSLCILNPTYFPIMFAQGLLTAQGGLSLLAGALCIVGFYRRWLLLPKMCALIGVHALLLGYVNWSAPAAWPGFLPPISLISFLLAGCIVAKGFRSSGPRRHSAGAGQQKAKPDSAMIPASEMGATRNEIRHPQREW